MLLIIIIYLLSLGYLWLKLFLKLRTLVFQTNQFLRKYNLPTFTARWPFNLRTSDQIDVKTSENCSKVTSFQLSKK